MVTTVAHCRRFWGPFVNQPDPYCITHGHAPLLAAEPGPEAEAGPEPEAEPEPVAEPEPEAAPGGAAAQAQPGPDAAGDQEPMPQ